MNDTISNIVTFDRIRLFASIALIIVFGAFIVAISISNSSYDQAYADNAAEITKLESRLSEISDQVAVSGDKVVKSLNSASEAGNAVATYQNKYSDISGSFQEETFMENVEALSNLLDEESQSGRVQWYSASDVTYKWEFCSNYTFAGNELDCIWLCYKSDATVKADERELLAYATATYDVNTALFSNVNYSPTSLGERYASVTEVHAG